MAKTEGARPGCAVGDGCAVLPTFRRRDLAELVSVRGRAEPSSGAVLKAFGAAGRVVCECVPTCGRRSGRARRDASWVTVRPRSEDGRREDVDALRDAPS
jgi:hypothetical protein